MDHSMADDALRERIAGCRICEADLPLGSRPIVRFSRTARILIIGQAPGAKVHESGVPWADDSGRRLREWMAIGERDFYDPAVTALVPMGFCYPGRGRSGDLPPRRECAPQWHETVLDQLPEDRLTILIGAYAQVRYLPEERRISLAQRVRNHSAGGPVAVLPHPSWRSTLFIRTNPWFEAETLPALRAAVQARLG
jgi:uracil-DNA glycosylase